MDTRLPALKIILSRDTHITCPVAIRGFSVQFAIMIAMGDELKPLDPAYVANTLSNPPFVPIPGVCNVRDLGSYPAITPNVVTKPGYAYRAAEISSITKEGVQMNPREKHSGTLC